jgi:enamine deaminase RidA (YjgF/YER057c/UK114 family)
MSTTSPRAAARAATFAGARHEFSMHVLPDAAAAPLEAAQALAEAVAAAVDAGALARLALYLPATLTAAEAAPVLEAALGTPAPPVELLAQPLVGGGAAAFAWTVAGDGVEVRRLGDGAARIAHGGVELTVLAHAGTEPPVATPEDFAAALDRFDARVRAHGVRFADVVKLWTVFPCTPQLGTEAAFNAFNRGRAEAFARLEFDPGAGGAPRYPASTGVGALDDTGPLSGIALTGAAPVQVENPRQVSAWDYPAERIATPALFSRAIGVQAGGQAMTFVAGTGSTVGAKTAHVGDPRAQAEQVLRNIDTLIGADNLRASGLPVQAGGLETLSHIVVYAATEEAEDAAREVCERMVPADVPMLLVRSRLTRDELLVEADGIAFSALLG